MATSMLQGVPPKEDKPYGPRPNGTAKGKGFLGEVPMKDGKVMTELTIGVNLDGEETDIPAIVPTLTQEELDHLASGGEPTEAIVQKAVDHAKSRMSEGKSPYADEGKDPSAATQQNPQEQQLDPKVEKEVQAYTMGLSKMLHSKKTQPQVVQMLKSGGDPETMVPQIALLINDQMETAVKQKGQKPSLEVLLGAAQFLVGDLIEMGNAIGVFQVETEEQVGPILQNTMQKYIEKGLKDGSVDPIELQQKVEPMMPEDMRQKALGIAEAEGIPAKPNQLTAMEAYAQKRMAKGGR